MHGILRGFLPVKIVCLCRGFNVSQNNLETQTWLVIFLTTAFDRFPFFWLLEVGGFSYVMISSWRSLSLLGRFRGCHIIFLPADPPPSLMAGRHQVNAAALVAHDRALVLLFVSSCQPPPPPPRS